MISILSLLVPKISCAIVSNSSGCFAPGVIHGLATALALTLVGKLRGLVYERYWVGVEIPARHPGQRMRSKSLAVKS
jgi:hypothetical protein